jgi:hypothetical protein
MVGGLDEWEEEFRSRMKEDCTEEDPIGHV